ncbi:MAG: putative toxin-antitoxin system toxin component, PIN family [Planctomycetota bacterium]|nr:putative toxin-antitoxin system toxin component, PIN family [Planctomycetaceae bacterium]MDQ3329764.1 putative toxin-antitoxin system toxin component, PIN family [Planctomycetota bacterium]
MIDTNIFVAAVRAPGSSSRQLLDAVSAGRATLLVSPPVFNEYRHILPKAVQSDEREQIIREWISRAEPVDAERGPRVVPDDPDDDKFVALAIAGNADAIVSNDEHLLGLGKRIDVPVLRPGEAMERLDASKRFSHDTPLPGERGPGVRGAG